MGRRSTYTLENKLGYDPWLHTVNAVKLLRTACRKVER